MTTLTHMQMALHLMQEFQQSDIFQFIQTLVKTDFTVHP
jgi:hypothetical protein